MFGTIYDIYAPTVQYHDPLMKYLYGAASVMHQILRLVASMPDMIYMPQHICSVSSEEGENESCSALGYGILLGLGDNR